MSVRGDSLSVGRSVPRSTAATRGRRRSDRETRQPDDGSDALTVTQAVVGGGQHVCSEGGRDGGGGELESREGGKEGTPLGDCGRSNGPTDVNSVGPSVRLSVRRGHSAVTDERTNEMNGRRWVEGGAEERALRVFSQPDTRWRGAVTTPAASGRKEERAKERESYVATGTNSCHASISVS